MSNYPYWDENIWFSSRYAIHNFWRLAKTVGPKVTKLRKYQRDREAWITAVVLLAMRIKSGLIWWIQIPSDDPPDISCGTLVEDQKLGRVLNQQDVEIMEITKYSRGSIEAEIKQKLTNKSYPPRYVLIIYLRRDQDISDIRLLSERVKLFNPLVSAIWCVGNTKPGTNNNIVFSIYPDVDRYDINIDEEIQKVPVGDILNAYRGSKNISLQQIKITQPYSINPERNGER